MMECHVFCWGKEVPDGKDIEVLKAHRQIGEEMGAVRKIVAIFRSAVGDGRADSGSSIERSAAARAFDWHGSRIIGSRGLWRGCRPPPAP
jgi:hypothetical protein